MRQVLKLAAVMTVFGLSPVLTGCGFVPLYAQQGLTASLSQIEIEAPQTRTGYFVEQELRNGFGSDLTSPKAYTLKITMKESHFKVGYKVDETSTRSEITSVVKYSLKDNATGKVIYSNEFSDTVTYDTSKSPLTGVISQQSAQKRIATSIAGKIQTELALYFHDRPPV